MRKAPTIAPRKCGGCGVEFAPASNSQKFCAPECRRVTYQVRYRETNRLSARRVYRDFTAEDWRERNLKMKYDLTLEEWEAMFDAQGRRCYFGCTEHGNRNWSTDHCHETGRVRAILCAKHNTMVGYIEKNAADLADVLLYIESHKKEAPHV